MLEVLQILLLVYIIGFVLYLADSFIDFYKKFTDDAGVVGRVFLAFMFTLMAGSLIATFWPIIWYLEQREEDENKPN